jgi:tetratricopeptide (TPR) repeat protein
LENKLGILHARFGEERTAESRFQEAMQIAPQYLSSYLNMANLKLLQEAPRQALEYLEQGEALRPSSVMVNALLAKTYYHIGEQEQAQKHYRLVHEQAPGVAEPLAYIEGAGDAPGDTGRAGDAGSSESLLWSLEAE